MNKIDLRIKYHHDTGHYPIEGNAESLALDFEDIKTGWNGIEEYIEWLESFILDKK